MVKVKFPYYRSPGALLIRFMAIVMIVLAAWLIYASSAHAQRTGPVQELTGRVDQGGGTIYVLPDLEVGQTLYLYANATSGDLDPIFALADTSVPATTLGAAFNTKVTEGIESGIDPLLVIPDVVDELFLAWDDDSGVGYDSALEFPVPADGSYLLVVTSNPTQDTIGGFRLLLGIDTPEVLTGEAEPTGDIIAVVDKNASESGVAIRELRDTFTADKTDTFYTLHDLDPGDTLYVYVEATSGNLAPVAILEDFGGKPIRSGNFLGEESTASFEYTFNEPASNYQISLSACCEDEQRTVGDYRLLVGVNSPEVLDGRGQPHGDPIIQVPLDVQIGLRMQQITSVDQKSENFGAVVTVQMRWQDPALAYSPADCQCNVKILNGNEFANFAADNGIIWPEYTLFNQQGRRDTQNQLVVLRPDGQALYFERFSATLQAPDFDFTTFPFDTQQFFIRLDALFPEELVVFSDLEGFSQLGDQLGEEEWVITDFETEISTQTASTQQPSSRFSFGFQAKRHVSFYSTRVFIPILVILVVSWFTFFLKDYGKRVDVSAGNLLLFIAFNFTIAGDLPRLGYLTFLDVILISTFVVTGLVVIFNVALKRLELAGKVDLAHRIDRYTIWIYPLVYVAAIGIVLYFFT